MDVVENVEEADGSRQGTTVIPDKVPSGVFKINGATVEEFTQNGLGSIVQAMKAINAFPSGPNRTIYSSYPSFNTAIAQTSDQILGIIAKVLTMQKIKGNIQRRDNDEKFELLLECNDFMLERINSNLDEMAGIKKNPEMVLVHSEIQTKTLPQMPLSGSWNENRLLASVAKIKTTKLLTARNILRPQISFKVAIDNSNATPFEPRLKEKPNSLKPLAILPEYGDGGDDGAGEIVSYLHPYEFELTKFEPSVGQLKTGPTTEAAPLETTPLAYVDTESQLHDMLNELRTAKELAVDLEHHSYRTFQGITCLMQISTRSHDYIIDTLALREELHVLNEVFTDPRVVKVFHGADSDIEWLQRDLSLYVVNLFDTHQAAKRLNLARLSLAFLLKQYCRLDVDKTFQLADWRIRPLPEELIKYARQDTHYLLYVYDVMRNDLLAAANGQTNLLKSVYQSSREICLKRYIKPKVTADSYLDLYAKSKRSFDNRQLHALQAIYLWRDKIARQEDESTGYVLPNHMMLQIAEILPREMQGILACCNPIPPLVRQMLHALHQFVLKARDQPLVKPIPEIRGANRGAQVVKNKDLSGLLFCPHDLTHSPEFRDDLPTLLGSSATAAVVTGGESKLRVSKRSSCSVFDSPETSEDDELRSKVDRVKEIKFVSPYARYLAILPLAEKQRLADQARKDLEDSKKKLCPDKVAPEDQKFIIKSEPSSSEPTSDHQQDHMPLKDFGKRRRELSSAEQAATPQPATKRQRFDINVRDSPQSTPSSAGASHDGQSPSTPTNTNHQQRKSKKPAKPMSNKKPTQSSDKPVAFDYSQVDFGKFQGGSKSQVNTNQSTSKFHGKNKSKRGHDKKFNKLLTFNKGKKKQ